MTCQQRKVIGQVTYNI